MESSQILIAGIGGLGCIWAARAHQRGAGASLLMLDADDRFPEAEGANIIRLGHTLDALGCAALPPLAEQRMRGLATRTRPYLEQAELVIIVAGLGGGTGTGASHEFARQAKLHGATVLSIAALPFESQPTRKKIAEAEIQRLEHHSDVCVQLSLERLARQADHVAGHNSPCIRATELLFVASRSEQGADAASGDESVWFATRPVRHASGRAHPV